MEVRRGNPPQTIERQISVDLNRDEILAVVVNHIKSKIGPNLRFDDIQVAGDENDRLQFVTVSGVEVVQLSWKDEKAEPTS